MRAGLLRNKITIQSPTKSKNGYGEVKTTWTGFDCRAQVQYQSGQMKATQNQIFNTDKIYFTIYDKIKIDESCRILFDDNKYKIDFIKKNPWPAMSKTIETEIVNE
jgi:SPP1 family predicted phage head-tail adaptor